MSAVPCRPVRSDNKCRCAVFSTTRKKLAFRRMSSMIPNRIVWYIDILEKPFLTYRVCVPRVREGECVWEWQGILPGRTRLRPQCPPRLRPVRNATSLRVSHATRSNAASYVYTPSWSVDSADSVEVSRPTRHRTGHFGDVLPSQPGAQFTKYLTIHRKIIVSLS